MRTSTRCLLLATAVTLSFGAHARLLTPAEALHELVNQQSGGKQRIAAIVSENSELAYTASAPGTNEAAVYVFNKPDRSGFIVVAADSDVPNLLLGFSDGDAFCNTHHSIHWWLSEYAAEIGVLRVNKAKKACACEETPQRMASAPQREAIEPLLHTIWSQSSPYNDQCPYPAGNTTERCPSGCVATALAQVMNHHKWPVTGTGQHSYYSSTAGRTLTFDYASTTFEWDKMMNFYTHDSSTNTIIQARRNAVATLLYAAGVGVDMNYSLSGSGSNYYEGATALLNYFNYDKGMQLLERNYFPLEQWTTMIYDELAADRPVLYGGQNTQSGHAFVIDGYDTRGYFHVNWGWAGLSDGYYLITALDPLEQGTGGSAYGYNSGQNMIIGVQPPVPGSKIKPSLKFINGFKVDQTEYTREEGTEVMFGDNRGIFNNTLGGITMTLGVKLVAPDSTVTYLEGTQPTTLTRDQGTRSYYVAADAFPQSGSYEVFPAFLDADGEWHDALVPVDGVRAVDLTATPDALIFDGVLQSRVEAIDLMLNTDIVVGYNFALTATLRASEGEYYGRIVPLLERNGREVASGTSLMVDIADGETSEYEWVSKFGTTVTAGDYQLYLIDAFSNVVSDTLNVTISPAPGELPDADGIITLDNVRGGNGTADNPYIIDQSTFGATITINGESGYFAQNVSAYIFSADNNALAATLPGDFLGLRAGARESIHVSADLSDISDTRVYMATPWASSQGKLGEPVYFIDEAAALDDATTRDVRISVSPNPTTDCVEIVATTPLAEVGLLTSGGAEIARVVCDGSTETTMCLGASPAGIYLLEVTDMTGATSIHKVIKR